MRKVIFIYLLLNISFGIDYCFKRAEKVYGVPYELLLAIALAESGLNPEALNKNRNGTYDIGIMQINTSNLSLLKRVGIIKRDEELWIPCKNVEAGAYILKLCIKRHGLTWRAVDCYNKGKNAKG
ncbi:MAG TPA: invasion protein IagB, partial [Aquifex aeolicus]|nr:invasion protein IagB [Aquifex aeolicus]